MSINVWIKKAQAVHGNKYDYSESTYTRAKDKIVIRCHSHSYFTQTACSHLQGAGCPVCGKETISASRTKGFPKFLEDASRLHGNRYDYSEAVWVNSSTRILVGCSEHGKFSIVPKLHTGVKAQGCPQCSADYLSKVRRSTTEKFVSKAVKIHGCKYDYSNTVYVDKATLVQITCLKHQEEFATTPSYHLSMGGCPTCGGIKRQDSMAIPFSLFLERARLRFGGLYEYEEASYKGVAKSLNILCQDHGWFSQPGYVHLRAKVGCPMCTCRIPLTQEEVLGRLRGRFGNTLDYSKLIFKDTHSPLELRCLTHNHTFRSLLHNMLKDTGNGCVKCALESAAEVNRVTFAEFLWRAKETHGNKFTYKGYINISSPVTVTCNDHGEFSQNASSHINGSGCAQCRISTIEREIITYLRMLGVEAISGDRKTIRSVKGTALELDIFVPSKSLAIEVNGAMWHSEKVGRGNKYHLHKTIECEKKGIQLIHVFDDEYKDNKEMVLSKLAHLCGVGQTIKIAARKCVLKEVTNDLYQNFMRENHLQGAAPASIRIGLYFEGKLISILGISKSRSIFKQGNKDSGEWELVRFATHKSYHCVGGLGKMIAWFKANVPFTRLMTFADRRWSIGKGYEAVGFSKVGVTDPGYWYCDDKGKRFHRFTFAKHKLSELLTDFNPELTEVENMSNNGYYRVWDCGNLKYEILS